MRCAFCSEKAYYRCARSGALLCPQHARLEVVAPRGVQSEELTMNGKEEKITVRPAEAHDYLRIEELAYHFGGEREVECFEARYDVSRLPALVAMSEGEVVGFLSYTLEKETLVLVMLNILPAYQGHGGARALFKAAVREAKERGLSRLLVATSNDDLLALYLYQRWGFTLKACLVGKVAEHHGGVMPGFAGIGVRDELQLELGLK